VTANTIGVSGLAHSRLPARLTSLQELTKIGSARTGSEGFSQELLTEAEALLRRSGERMRMSASHTVVALAGGTGQRQVLAVQRPGRGELLARGRDPADY
jgi:hypothetical protein